MRRKTGFTAALLGGMLISGPLAVAQDNSSAVIIDWNQKLQATIGATGGPLAPRWYATMHIAQFDAINSIERDYTPFHTRVAASSGASTKAAAAQAAHDVLVVLLPANAATYDALLAEHLAGIPAGLAAQGSAVGRAAAQKILEWRLADGFTAVGPAFRPPAIAGLWQETGAPAGVTQAPAAISFTLKSNTQFLPRRFPELDTAAYAEDYNEVRTIGSATSITRTAEQTQTAKLFAAFQITSTNIVVMWNTVVRDMVTSRHLTMIEAARLYAMTDALIIDGLLTTFTGKFTYALWRPVTAINSTLDDLNPLTAPEPGWAPLIPTPPYPSYPGNMACVGIAAAKSLALALGTDSVTFSVTWTGANGNPNVTRTYSSFSELAQQEADSRIYGGIHYRFDNEASQEVCPKVVEQAYATVARPLG
jgi:hypothetical protein